MTVPAVSIPLRCRTASLLIYYYFWTCRSRLHSWIRSAKSTMFLFWKSTGKSTANGKSSIFFLRPTSCPWLPVPDFLSHTCCSFATSRAATVTFLQKCRLESDNWHQTGRTNADGASRHARPGTLVSSVRCSSRRLRVPATDDWINSQLWTLCTNHLPAVPRRAEHHAAARIQ